MAELTDGNMARIDVEDAPGPVRAKDGTRPERNLLLVIDADLRAALGDALPEEYHVHTLQESDGVTIEEAAAAGAWIVWIGPGYRLPAAMSLGCHRPSQAKLAVYAIDGAPLGHVAAWKPATLSGVYLAPPKEMPAHNCDEEVRGEFLPLLEARDRFGSAVAYPGVLMSYNAPSLAAGRFVGCEAFLFLFDDPAAALPKADWHALLGEIAARYRSGIQVRRFTSDYASYRAGERAQLRVTVTNHGDQASAVELQLLARGPNDDGFRPLRRLRRCPAAHDESEARFDVLLPAEAGLWTLRVDISIAPGHLHELGVLATQQVVDRRELAIVQLAGAVETPEILTIEGPVIQLDGRNDFWVGTHYYPSSSWWEWLWRDFRPQAAARDFTAIRREGYRLVRVWIDPVLDEVTLRAMDAAIWLAAREGLVLDFCIFNQWIRSIGYERPNGELVDCVYRRATDFNVFGISFLNMELQREYASVMARRWRRAGNVIYNLSNETYIKDPDATQLDPEAAAWPEATLPNGCLRDSLLFQRWGREITTAMRAAGARQSVLPGYLFSTLKGGDNHLANREAEIVPWHCYLSPEMCALTLQYFDSTCSDRPIILEEFGTLGWNPAAHYDGCAHYALAGGAAAAMSYEWGVSWLAQEMCYTSLPMREADVELPDPRWFGPAVEIGRSWPARGVGICLTPSGFGYGSIYHGTPFPAEAAIALGRLGRMGQGLGRARRDEQTYVLVPTAGSDSMEALLPTFNQLWRMKVPFGVWQEDCLQALPATARVLIAPLGVGGAASTIEALRERGLEVHIGTESDWASSHALPRIGVTPDAGVDLLLRHTVQGTLYTLAADDPIDRVRLELPSGPVETAVEGFALIHASESGVLMLEAAGRVRLQGRDWCRIEQGRALIASATAEALTQTHSLRVLATRPTTIHFERPLASLAIEDERTGLPGAVMRMDGADPRTLEIDDELYRHVLRIEFA